MQTFISKYQILLRSCKHYCKPEFFLFSKNHILLSPVQVAVFWITGFNGFGFLSVLGVWSFVIVLSGQQYEWVTDSTDDFPRTAVGDHGAWRKLALRPFVVLGISVVRKGPKIKNHQ